MKKFILLFLIIYPLSLHAIGTGISLFIPPAAPLEFETALETRILLDKIGRWWLPVSIAHNQIYGLSASGVDWATQPWFYANTLQLRAMIERRIPVKIFHISLFFGPTLQLPYTVEAIQKRIESDLATHIGADAVSFSSLSLKSGIGWGLNGGVGFGIKFDRITLQLAVMYQWAISSLTLSGNYRSVSGNTATLSSLSPLALVLKQQGLSISFFVDMKLF